MEIFLTFFEAQMGFLGQHTTPDSNRVWVCKTHYPAGRQHNMEFAMDKNLVIVRNPIDAFPSYIGLRFGLSHSLVPQQKINEEFPDWWEQWLELSSKSLASFHRITVDEIGKQVPTYYVRYEDLREKPAEVLREVFQFLLDVPSLDGTIVESRIEDTCSQGTKNVSLYKLKSESQNLSRQAHMYSEDNIKLLTSHLSDYIRFFGYTG